MKHTTALLAGWLVLFAGDRTTAGVVYDILPLDASIFGDYNSARVTAINNSNMVIGAVQKITWTGEYWDGGNVMPAVWDLSQIKSNGISHLLLTNVPAQQLAYPWLEAFNDQGQACGYYYYVHQDGTLEGTRPFLYDLRSRIFTPLGGLGDDRKGDPLLDDYGNCYGGAAGSINNASVITGNSTRSETNIFGKLEGSVYSTPTCWHGGPKPEAVEWAGKINNNNKMVCGSATSRDFYLASFQSATPLPIPSDRPGWWAWADDLNDSEYVVGYIWLTGQAETEPALWHPQLGYVRLPVYPNTQSAVARAINNQGLIVGKSNVGAVLWMGSGTNYQIISMDMYAMQTGWRLDEAIDINDSGWIIGRGTYNGLPTAFVARARLDQNPPTATLKSNSATWSKGRLAFTIVYSDDFGIDTNRLGNTDVTARFPDGSTAPARLEKVMELASDPGASGRKYEAKYSVPEGGLNPFNPGQALISVLVASGEVFDLGDLAVASGKIGEIPLGSAVAITRGFTAGTNGQPAEWRFETRLFLGVADQTIPILSAKVQAPGDSTWWSLVTTNRQEWRFGTNSATPLPAFGPGDYHYSITISNGGPQEFTFSYRLGYGTDGNPMAAPAVAPQILSPTPAGRVDADHLALRWAAPAEPAVSRIYCQLVDARTQQTVFAISTTNLQGPLVVPPGVLQPEHDYRAELYFCGGVSQQTETNQWITAKLLYAAAQADFSTLASPATPTLAIRQLRLAAGQMQLYFEALDTTLAFAIETTTNCVTGPWLELGAVQITSVTNHEYRAEAAWSGSGPGFFRIRGSR